MSDGRGSGLKCRGSDISIGKVHLCGECFESFQFVSDLGIECECRTFVEIVGRMESE
jgi:hypothetical protein